MIRKHFAGDADSTTRRIQQKSCPDHIELLYTCARTEYLKKVKASERQNDKLFKVVKNILCFDDHILFPAYDRVAAWFRFKHTELWQTRLFPTNNSTVSDSLPPAARVEQAWIRFFRSECEAIARHGETARAVLNAVGFAGQDRGEDALRALLDLLDQKYRALTNARRRWGQFKEMREFCDW